MALSSLQKSARNKVVEIGHFSYVHNSILQYCLLFTSLCSTILIFNDCSTYVDSGSSKVERNTRSKAVQAKVDLLKCSKHM